MTVLGISSIYRYPKTLLGAIKEAAMLGFRHINIFAYPPHFVEDSDEFIRKVSKVLLEYGIDCSIKIQGYTLNIAATNPNLRKKSFEEVMYWLEVASKLNCSAVVLRAGMFFYSERVFKDKTYDRLVRILRDTADRAHELGLELFVENYPYPFDVVVLPSDFYRLCRDVHSRLYLALNIPHLYDIYKSRRIDVLNELQLVLSHIRMAYVSDHINPWDCPHKVGESDMEEYMRFTGGVLREIKKGELGLVVIIGYSKDEIVKIKEIITQIGLI